MLGRKESRCAKTDVNRSVEPMSGCGISGEIGWKRDEALHYTANHTLMHSITFTNA